MSAERAAALHRQAAAVAAVAGAALDGYPHSRHGLAARLRAAAAAVAPGWLSAPLDATPASTPLGGLAVPGHVRVGQAQTGDDARFPVVLPLVGTGHLAIDADARDGRVAGLLRSVVLRLLAAAPAGTLRILPVDGADTFDAFTVLPPAAVGADGLRSVLSQAEASVRAPRPGTHLLVVIAALPELTEPADLARIAAVAEAGPAAGVHLVVAGWPPPPLTPESTQPPLPHATQISLRNPYVRIGDPPGASFGAGRRLNAPVYLDAGPPAALVRTVCAELSATAPAGTVATAGAAAGWSEYLAAAGQLGAPRPAVEAAGRELVVLRQRLAYQRRRLGRLGLVAAPAPADLEAARRAVTGPEAVPAALARAAEAVDTADALLPETALRSVLVYCGYALLAVLAEIGIFATVGLAAGRAVPAIAAMLAVPVAGYALAWLTTAALAPARDPRRLPLLGAGISGLAVLPALVLAALLLVA